MSVTDRGQLALARDQPTPGLPPFAPDAYSGCEPGVTPPLVVRRVQPRYTADALQARIQGTVLLRAVVMPDGRVGKMQVE